MSVPKRKPAKRSTRNSKSKPSGNQRLSYALAWVSVAFCWCFGFPSLLMGSYALWQMKGSKQKDRWQQLGQFAAITGTVIGFCFTLYFVASLVSGAYIHFK